MAPTLNLPTPAAPPARVADRITTALDALAAGGTHQSVAAHLLAAGVKGGLTGGNNAVAAYLADQVPESRPWGLHGAWVDEQVMWRGQLLPVPDPVFVLLILLHAGHYPELVAETGRATPQMVRRSPSRQPRRVA